MSTHVWPPPGPLTRWALGKLEERGEDVEELSDELEARRVAKDLHDVCGMCLYAIAREMSVSCQEARRLLDAAGVPRREWR